MAFYHPWGCQANSCSISLYSFCLTCVSCASLHGWSFSSFKFHPRCEDSLTSPPEEVFPPLTKTLFISLPCWFFFLQRLTLSFSHKFTCLYFTSSVLKLASCRQGHCLHGALVKHKHSQSSPPWHGYLAKNCWISEWVDGYGTASLSRIYKYSYIYLDYNVVMGRWWLYSS